MANRLLLLLCLLLPPPPPSPTRRRTDLPHPARRRGDPDPGAEDKGSLLASRLFGNSFRSARTMSPDISTELTVSCSCRTGLLSASAPRSLYRKEPLCLAMFDTSLSLEIPTSHLDSIAWISPETWMRLYGVIGMIIDSIPLQRIARRPGGPENCILHNELYRWRRLIR